jgi:hypothetical protein
MQQFWMQECGDCESALSTMFSMQMGSLLQQRMPNLALENRAQTRLFETHCSRSVGQGKAVDWGKTIEAHFFFFFFFFFFFLDRFNFLEKMEEPKHLSASSSARSIPRIRSRRGDAKNPLRRTISANSLSGTRHLRLTRGSRVMNEFFIQCLTFFFFFFLFFFLLFFFFHISGSGSLEGETTTSDSANQSMKERLRRDSQSLSDSCEKIILNPDKEKSVVDTGSTRNSVTTEEKVNVSPVAPPILADTPPVVVVASPEQSLVSRLHKPVHSSAPSPQGRNTSDDVVLGLRRSNRDVLRKSAHLEPAETAPLTRKSREEQTSPGRSALMSSGEDPLLLGRRGSLLGSGSGLLEFLGFRRKSSTSGIATDVGPRMAPPRMVVGNYLVARQRDALSQRSLRQEGKMLVVMRLNMNKVDFMVNLTAVTIVEQRGTALEKFFVCFLKKKMFEEEEFMGGRMMCVTLTAGRELVLISAGSDEETESLHELLTAW